MQKHTGCQGDGCVHCANHARLLASDPAAAARMAAALGFASRRKSDPTKPRAEKGGCALKAVRVGGRDILPGFADPMGDVAVNDSPPWATSPCVRHAHVKGFGAMLAAAIRPPARADGDGVVTCGGGRYWPGLVVSLRMTRAVTGLPIQVWHRRDEPVDPAEVADLAGITFHDVSAATPVPRRLTGWEAKAIALLNCGLRRAIFVDADAYFLADPGAILDAASASRIAFWTDVGDHIDWAAFGLTERHGSYVPPFQGGQFAVDLVAARRELVLLHWLCQHSDYSFRHGHGDQEMFRVALAATGGSYATLGQSAWADPGFVCRLGGAPAVSHRVDCKFGIDTPKNPPDLPGEAEAVRIYGAVVRGDFRPRAADVFGDIYRAGGWGEVGSSGEGSSDGESAPYVAAVNRLAAALGWRSAVDLGCGDGRVISKLRVPKLTGVECHEPHVRRLSAELPGVEFLCLDADRDRSAVPAADAVILKDVLMHWPSVRVREWLDWAAASGRWGYVVLCDSVGGADGSDCPLGGYRPLDPRFPPLAGLKLVEVARYANKAVHLLKCKRVV